MCLCKVKQLLATECVLIDQRVDRRKWITMQTMQEATRFLCFIQTSTMLKIAFIGNSLDLAEQLCFAFRQKEHLMLAKISQWTSAGATTEATLLIAQPAE